MALKTDVPPAGGFLSWVFFRLLGFAWLLLAARLLALRWAISLNRTGKNMSRNNFANPLILLAAVVVANAHAEVIYDDFGDSKWVSSSTSTVKVFEQFARLKIEFPQNAQGYVFSGGYFSTCRLTGDFDISTDYSVPAYPEGNGVRVGLMVDIGQKNGVWVNNTWAVMERISNKKPLESIYDTDFSNYGTGIGSPTNTLDTKGKFRLTRMGTQLTGYYWDWITSSWIQSRVTSSFTTNPVYFGVTSWSHDIVFGKVNVRTTFDNVKIKFGKCLK